MHKHDYECNELGAAERLVPALVLIGIGLVFLLKNLQLVYFREVFAYWPVILIAFGIVKLVDSAYQGGRVLGGFLMVVGGLLLARNLGFLDIPMRDLWPLFLIGAGLLMLFQRTIPGLANSIKQDSSANTLNETAVFSGGKRNITTSDFQGASINAVFGGFELDFRRAGMAAESAVIEINAVFGGCEILIPRSWAVEMKGAGIFGAFSDETTHPDPAQERDIRRLVVQGSAVFGGVVLKN
jgi:predicted membrane protein